MSAQPEPLAYTVDDAAAAAGVSDTVLRRAIHADGSDPSLPPLAAKLNGTRLLITRTALLEWLDALPNA